MRYQNMDYILFSALKNTQAVEVDVSYDVACIWRKNSWNTSSFSPTISMTGAKLLIFGF